jgi:hypothetical protein
MNTSTYSLFSSTVSACRKAGRDDPGGPGVQGTAATSGRSGAAPDRCPRHAGSPAPWAARPSRRVSSVRRGSGGVPAAGSPSPGVQCPGPPAAARACAACSWRSCCRRVCGARPAASRASRGRCPVQRLRGRSRPSAASHTRSAGSYRTRPACRRSTAFSCRSTSSSASLARSPRNTRTARPSTRHVSRYTMLSSTRPASHHRVHHAGDSAGQPLNRVFERHTMPVGDVPVPAVRSRCLVSVWRCRRRTGRDSTLRSSEE